MKLQFRVGNGEFGEVYHLAVTSYLLRAAGEQLAVKFVNFPEGEEFFKFLKIETASVAFEAGWQPLPITAKIILEHFYGGCLKPLADVIVETAQKEGRAVPYPELLTPGPKLLIWQRDKKGHDEHRNSTRLLLEQLVGLCHRHKTAPVVVVGPHYGLSAAPKWEDFYRHDFFKVNSIAKQLWFIHELFRSNGAIANVGMMSGAMDGPTMFFGRKAVYLARHEDATPRMQKVSIAVPNLIWQRIDYEGRFQKLTDGQLGELERNLWPA